MAIKPKIISAASQKIETNSRRKSGVRLFGSTAKPAEIPSRIMPESTENVGVDGCFQSCL